MGMLTIIIKGSACFLCSDDETVSAGGSGIAECPRCVPAAEFDLSQGQQVLEHIGMHILYDPAVVQSLPLYGICLCPLPQCQFFLKKGKGANASLTINHILSKGCTMKVKYTYSIAAESSPSSPCSNVPAHCPLFPKSDPAIWKYFLKIHFQDKHKNAPLTAYEELWKLLNFELSEMKVIWAKRLKTPLKCTKKSKGTPLVIAEDYHMHIPSL